MDLELKGRSNCSYMYSYNEITNVHLEPAAKCNLACPMCARNISGGKINPRLPLQELSLKDIQTILPRAFIRQLRSLVMCGNYGDPFVARDTLKILNFLKSENPFIYLTIITNGSGRNPNWWKALAKCADKVHFSIDGLEDTNHIYRRGAVFSKIMQNARAFISEGGTAIWDYIAFRHNEHQWKTARDHALAMGFHKFVLKKTSRFRRSNKEAFPVLDKNGQVEYILQPPKDRSLRHRGAAKEKKLIQKYKNMLFYYNNAEIDCKVIKKKSVYISAEGFVFPCCWIAGSIYNPRRPKKGSQIWRFIEKLPQGIESLNAKKRPLEDIVKGAFFASVKESWKGKNILKDKLGVCAAACSKGLDPYQLQWK